MLAVHDAENPDEESWTPVVAIGEDRREAQHLTPAVKIIPLNLPPMRSTVSMKELQTYLSRVEVEAFGHLL